MTHKDLHDALERAADPVGEVDLVDAAWSAGRAQRTRRRTAIGVGGAAMAAAAVVGAVALSGGLQQQGSPDPAGTPGPSGTQAEPDGTPTDGVDQSEPTRIETPSGFPPRGTHVVLAFAADKDWEPSGDLEPATAEATVDRDYWLIEPETLGTEPEPVAPDGTGIQLSFDGQQVSVRGCGLDMQAPGTVDGTVQVLGDWQVEPDPDPGIACVWHEWLGQDRWREFLGAGPTVASDGPILVLSGLVGDEPIREDTSVVFTRLGVADPQNGVYRAATWRDLSQGWVELGPERAGEELTGAPVADPNPDHAVTLDSPGTGEVTIDTGCNGVGLTGWLRASGEGDSSLLGVLMPVTAMGCTGPTDTEESLWAALLSGQNTVSINGDYLTVQGWPPTDLVQTPDVSAAPSDDASEGPTRSPEWGPLAVAEFGGGDDALISGTIQITDRCVLLDEGGDAVLLVWPHEGTTWDSEEMAVELVGRSGERAVLQDGDQVSFGGGGSSVDEDGTTASDFLESVTWIAEPHRECVSDVRWFVGDLANLDGS